MSIDTNNEMMNIDNQPYEGVLRDSPHKVDPDVDLLSQVDPTKDIPVLDPENPFVYVPIGNLTFLVSFALYGPDPDPGVVLFQRVPWKDASSPNPSI